MSLEELEDNQRDNQNPYIEEEQTIQWPNEKVQKDKQRSTKHTHTSKDRVTRTPLKIGGEFRCSGIAGSSCSTSGTRRVNLVTNPVISHEWGKDREVFIHVEIHIVVYLCVKLFNIQPVPSERMGTLGSCPGAQEHRGLMPLYVCCAWHVFNA
jgi:hypothetical protein